MFLLQLSILLPSLSIPAHIPLILPWIRLYLKKTILFIVMFLASLCIILKENHRDRTSCIKIFKYFCNTNLVFRRKVMNIRNGHVYSGIYYQK